ncbi:MAG: YHS domain protein [Bacteroidetes bacterium]|nr:MAG: YHS domain protein [Bacteroidota bacterium]
MKTKTLVMIAIAITFSLITLAQKSPVFATDGIAIRGYDPVAFFKSSEAQKGAEVHEYSWQGAKWRFATAANRDSFALNPEKYAPQYGGYCAFGCMQGHKAPTQVDTWTILDGKLYFNYNQKVKELWSKDKKGYIAKADEQWPKVKEDN